MSSQPPPGFLPPPGFQAPPPGFQSVPAPPSTYNPTTSAVPVPTSKTTTNVASSGEHPMTPQASHRSILSKFYDLHRKLVKNL